MELGFDVARGLGVKDEAERPSALEVVAQELLDVPRKAIQAHDSHVHKEPRQCTKHVVAPATHGLSLEAANVTQAAHMQANSFGV